MTADELPTYDVEEVAAALDESALSAPRVVGVVLAGGTSSRFGESNKLLAEFNGEPLVRHATRTLLRADLSEVVVVVGHEAEVVSAALDDLDVRVVRNLDHRDGLSTTVAEGVRAVEGADAAVFLPGDMPAVDPTTVQHLVDAYRADIGTAVAAAHDEQRGNPVLFDSLHFEDLLDVEGDVGGRSVLAGNEDAVLIDISDSGVLTDIDTVDDLRHQ